MMLSDPMHADLLFFEQNKNRNLLTCPLTGISGSGIVGGGGTFDSRLGGIGGGGAGLVAVFVAAR